MFCQVFFERSPILPKFIWIFGLWGIPQVRKDRALAAKLPDGSFGNSLSLLYL
jgi:hypothetical protein